MSTNSFYSHGKLLLTGEYAVLDGAKAMAFPCKLGQRLRIESSAGVHFEWISYLENGEIWKSVTFSKEDIRHNTSDDGFKKRLLSILNQIYITKPDLFNTPLKFSTHLEFNKNWGLGSSSTLISNLASWANLDPYQLLSNTFGGSGYDIAAATTHTPFIFQKNNGTYQTKSIIFPKALKPYIYFIYLNQKQNSREAIKHYRTVGEKKTESIKQISELTEKVLEVTDLKDFEGLMLDHEELISDLTKQIPVQTSKFSDYTHGIVKSLGAWGGDFVLVTAKEKCQLEYFKQKGYTVIYNYSELIVDNID